MLIPDTEGMIVCCECERASVWREAFQPGRNARGESGPLCPACWSDGRAGELFIMFIGFAILGLVGWVMADSPLKMIMISVSSVYFLSILLTPLHELAHVSAAWLLGFSVYGIQWGWYGREWILLRCGRFLLDVRRVPIGGFAHCADRSGRRIRGKWLLFVAAGPLLHILLIAAACSVTATDARLGYFLNLFLISNGYMLGLSFWPRNWRSGPGNESTDGAILWRLLVAPREEISQYPVAYYWQECQYLLRIDENAAALELCREGIQRFPEQSALQTILAYCHLNLGELDQAATLFREQLAAADSTFEVKSIGLNNLAWTQLITRQDAALAEGLDLAWQAYRIAPWEPYINGTLGALLVETGSVSAGMVLLERALAENAEPANRAINALFLCRACQRLGDHPAAQRFAERSQRLQPGHAWTEDWYRVEGLPSRTAAS